MNPAPELTGGNAFCRALCYLIAGRMVVRIAEILLPVLDAPDTVLPP